MKIDVVKCYIPSLFIQKIYPCGDTAPSISIKQAYLLWWPFFLQHIPMMIIQQSGYLIFYDRNTPIWLGLS